ncbi:Glycerol-3-phosphate dehydrogenase sdp6, mitochondrial [Asimina triloba]
MAASSARKTIGAVAAAAAAGGCTWGVLSFLHPAQASENNSRGHLESIRSRIADPNAVVPSREVQASALMGCSSVNPLDILVIGGGATGCGVALDAATRGLRVGLVEREDFSSGTSSRSTKLIHGDSNNSIKIAIADGCSNTEEEDQVIRVWVEANPNPSYTR